MLFVDLAVWPLIAPRASGGGAGAVSDAGRDRPRSDVGRRPGRSARGMGTVFQQIFRRDVTEVSEGDRTATARAATSAGIS